MKHTFLHRLSHSRWGYAYLLLINIVLLGLSNLYIRPFFQTNDDPGMMLRLAGVVTLNHGTANILFSNIAIAYPLMKLYHAFPGLPWYGIYFFVTIALAFTTLSYTILKMAQRKGALVYLLGLYLFFGFSFFIVWQFTLLAGLNFIAGFLSFYLYNIYCKQRGKKVNRFIIFVGFVHLLLAAFIRFQMLPLSLLVVLPLIIHYTFNWKYFKPGLALLAVALLCFFLDKANISFINSHYANYYNYNAARGTAAEFRSTDCLGQTEKDTILHSLNWTEEDVSAMHVFFFISPNAFSYEKLMRFDELTKPCINTETVSEVVKWHGSVFLHNVFLFLPFFLVLFVFIIFYRPYRSILLWYLLLFSWCYFILTVIGIVMKYPDFRVQYPLLVSVTVCLVIHASLISGANLIRNKKAERIVLLLSVIIFSGIVYTLCIRSLENRKNEKQLYTFLNAQKDRLLIVTGSALKFESISPYVSAAALNRYHAFFLGCFQQSQQDNEYLQSFGANNIEDAIFNKGFPVAVLNRDAKPYFGLLIYYGQRDYNRSVFIDTVFKDGDNLLLKVK